MTLIENVTATFLNYWFISSKENQKYSYNVEIFCGLQIQAVNQLCLRECLLFLQRWCSLQSENEK